MWKAHSNADICKLRISRPIVWRASSNLDHRLGWCWCQDWSWRCRGKNCWGWHFGVGPPFCHRFWPDPRQDLKKHSIFNVTVFGSHPWKAWQPKEEAMLVVHKVDRCYTTARNYWKKNRQNIRCPELECEKNLWQWKGRWDRKCERVIWRVKTWTPSHFL